MSNGGAVDRLDLARGQRRVLGVGVIALAVCAIAAPASPTQFFRAYLAAYLFYLGIALGSMVLLMAYHLTGGSWGLMIRRILEAAMRTLPLLALLFLPIAYGVDYLYPWAQPSLVAASPKLQYQQFYLQPKLFWIRAAVYFALWIVMAFWLSRWSRQEDRTGNPRLAWKSQQLSGLRRRHLRHQSPFRRRRLGHVAAAGVPFDDLGAAVCHRAVALGPGLGTPRVGLPDSPAAARRRGVVASAERFGKPVAHLADLVGLHGLVPVHARLDCEHAGGRGLVRAAHAVRPGKA